MSGRPVGWQEKKGQMSEKRTPPLPDELQRVFDRATAFGESPELMEAFREATREPRVWEEAIKDPSGFLRGRGVEVPEGLEVILLDDPMRQRPTPDFEFFSIRFFNCRTYWVKK